MSENSPAEADFFEERAINAGQAVTDGVHEHIALHAGQDLFHVRRRLVAGIGLELQFDERFAGAANACRGRFLSGVLEEEGIGECAYDAHRVLGARALLFALLSQFFGMDDETFDARLFLLALCGSQRFAVVGDHQAGSNLLGFDIESGGGPLRGSFGAAKQEVSGVVIGRLNFVLHGFANQFRWIAIRRNGGLLPGETGRGERQNPSDAVGDTVSDGIARDGVEDRHS